MTTETRFIDLLSNIPRGGFYDNIGNIIPFKSGNTTLRLLTNTPNTNYLVLVNNVENIIVTTDISGQVLFDIKLPLGDISLELQQESSTNKIVTYLTTREYAVEYAALAEQIERIDDFADSTLNSFYIDKAGVTDINLAHGIRLLTPNEFGADLDTYREILQFMRQAFRQFAGRLSGKQAVVAAITQVNPLSFDRSNNAPRWILGTNRITNGDFQTASRPVDNSDLSTQMNAIEAFVTSVSIDSFVNEGSGTLTYFEALRRFIWVPSDISKFVPVLSSPKLVNSPDIDSAGQFNITSGRSRAFLDTIFPDGSSEFTFGANFNRLYFNLDSRGRFHTLSVSEVDVDTVLSSMLIMARSSNHYEAQRRVDSQMAGLLTNYFEIVNVGDNTILNADQSIDIGTGTITTNGAGDSIAYTAPTDVVGSFVAINGGEVQRLFSDNEEFIDILTPFTNPPISTSDTFVIERRYRDFATKLSNKTIRLESKNDAINDGVSTIEVLDGPFSDARSIFNLDQQFAALSVTATAGTTQIEVPAGTAEAFSGVNSIINTPFKVLIGRGPGPTVVTANFEVSTPNGASPPFDTALLHNLIGVTLNQGHTHIKYTRLDRDLRSVMNGIHKLVNINEISNEATLINFGGTGTTWVVQDLGADTITGVHSIKIDPSLDAGVDHLELDFNFAGQTLSIRETGAGSFGPTINISTGGFFRLWDGAISTSKWLDVWVDVASLPGADDTGFISARNGFVDQTPGSGGSFQLWSAGEKNIVTNVIPNGGTELWDLKTSLIGTYDIGLGAYEILPFDRQPSVKFGGEDSFGDIIVTTGQQASAGSGIRAASIVVGDPKLPDGWIDKSGAPIDYVITPEAKFSKGAILINDDTNNVLFDKDVSFTEDQCGFSFKFRVWVRNVAATLASPKTHDIELILGFDFGNGLIESTPFSISSPDDTTQYPEPIEFSQVLPSDATQFKVRIRRTTGGSGAEKTIIERAILLLEPFDSLFLGDGTTPRSGGRSAFGSLFYIWSADELSQIEESVLGIGSPTPDGLIRSSHNAHEQIDSFNVTEVSGGQVLNVRGTVNDLDWISSTRTNLQVVPRSPTRFSYVKPVLPSLTENNILSVSQIFPFTAPLLLSSDQNQNNTIIFEDGIPLPNDQWVFNNDVEVEIVTGFVPGATYTIDYNLLTQVETIPIDLDSPSSGGMDTWFADYVVWNRHVSDIIIIRGDASLIFDASFNAILPKRSDQNEVNSVLTEKTGTSQRTIPQSAWGYADSLTVNIDGNQFNSNSIYSLEYNQRSINPSRAVNVVAEIKSANSVFSLGAATYAITNINGCVDSSKRFHQLRLTFSNIDSVRDLRVHSAVLKGLNFGGVGSPPPGF